MRPAVLLTREPKFGHALCYGQPRQKFNTELLSLFLQLRETLKAGGKRCRLVSQLDGVESTHSYWLQPSDEASKIRGGVFV